MASGDDELADEYARAMDALGGLISSHRRADGKFWTHAFDGMRVYLEVAPPPSPTTAGLRTPPKHPGLSSPFLPRGL